MERIQPKSKSKEQYTREFVVSANEQSYRDFGQSGSRVGNIMDDPQHGECGALPWLTPPAQIQPTVHPGEIMPWVHPTTARDRENYMIGHVRDMEPYKNELAINEAMKDFILTRVDPVYFDACPPFHILSGNPRRKSGGPGESIGTVGPHRAHCDTI